MQFKRGSQVEVEFGGNLPGGPFIGVIFDGPHGPEEKYTVQVGDYKGEAGYHEPGDGEDLGGGQFRKVA